MRSVKRYVLGFSYNGKHYIGYQSQGLGNSVQEKIEFAISKVANHDISTSCAGRTDKGVHALIQVLHFDSDAIRSDDQWIRGINANLPKDIQAIWIEPVDSTFHARFSAVSRSYVYVLNTQAMDLMMQPFVWALGDLDIDKMREASNYLLGEQDFYAFQSRDCQSEHSRRCIQAVAFETVGQRIYFHIKANAFLHHMVRKIVATLVAIGEGKLMPKDMKTILAEKDREKVPGQAPAKGLFLRQVKYKDAFGITAIGKSQLLGDMNVF